MLNQSDLVLTQHMTHLGPPGGPAFRPPIAPRKCHGAGFGDLQLVDQGPLVARLARHAADALGDVDAQPAVWSGAPGLRILGKSPCWMVKTCENLWDYGTIVGIAITTSDFMMFRNVLGVVPTIIKNGLSPFLGANEIDLLQFCLSRGMGRGKPIPPKITCLD